MNNYIIPFIRLRPLINIINWDFDSKIEIDMSYAQAEGLVGWWPMGIKMYYRSLDGKTINDIYWDEIYE